MGKVKGLHAAHSPPVLLAYAGAFLVGITGPVGTGCILFSILDILPQAHVVNSKYFRVA